MTSDAAAFKLVMMSVEAEEEQVFEYRGYRIPVRLINLTGGGTDTWDVIARGHMEQYARYAPIDRDASVLEVGCGVGRDAIQLADHLSDRGRYAGIASSSRASIGVRPTSPRVTRTSLFITSTSRARFTTRAAR